MLFRFVERDAVHKALMALLRQDEEEQTKEWTVASLRRSCASYQS
ncbi:hypothetical protein RchiOBHm_Chr1g0346351 [Rosa chinensis]|uniref:Uncharacterized protein n=1 Tax=Rosa chinensis TaxID=74649 RepID=A0A2P6SF07_ROSCH|nr:hypothetical protein RchiOBHm_Chr1g0346351 [Rosa chinensis]